LKVVKCKTQTRNNICLTYIITSDHKVTILHRFGEHAASSCTTHSIQSRFEFFIFNGDIIQEHTVLCSDKQIHLLTSRSYCKTGNRQIDIFQYFYFIFSFSSQVASEKNLIATINIILYCVKYITKYLYEKITLFLITI